MNLVTQVPQVTPERMARADVVDKGARRLTLQIIAGTYKGAVRERAAQALRLVLRERRALRETQELRLQYFVCPFVEALEALGGTQEQRVRRVIREVVALLGHRQLAVI